MIDLNFITTFYFLLLILSHIFVSFFENLNILVDFFHRKNCKNLHEFAPVASSDNLLFEATINKNIQDSKFFYHNNSSVSFHFLYGVIKGMLFIEHFMKNDTKWVNITFVWIYRFALSVMKIYFRGHCVRSSAFFTKNSQFRTYRFSEPEIGNLYKGVLYENVFKFEISVNDFFLVKVVHSFNNLLEIVNLLLLSNLSKLISQVAITKFESNIADLIFVPKVIELNDIRWPRIH